MTDSTFVAYSYAASSPESSFPYNFIFVNEVLKSEKLQTFIFDYDVMYERGDVTTLPKQQFKKHFLKSSPQPTKEDYIKDFEGRRYVNTLKRSLDDEYIAEAKVTLPRYLIVLKIKQNISKVGIE